MNPFPTAARWPPGYAVSPRRDGHGGPAAEWLAAAAAGFDGMAMPFDAAVCRLDWAEEVGETDAEAAAVAAERSVVVLDGLGARPAADRGRRLMRRLGRRPVARPRPPGKLSDRELEIARLVAEGLTNAAVAERLFISQRHRTSHLERHSRFPSLRSAVVSTARPSGSAPRARSGCSSTRSPEDIGGMALCSAVPADDVADRVATAVAAARSDLPGQHIERWYAWRPALFARASALRGVDLTGLTDAELDEQLSAALAVLDDADDPLPAVRRVGRDRGLLRPDLPSTCSAGTTTARSSC